MNKWQKIALGIFGVTYVAQTVGGLVVLKHCEKVEGNYQAAYKAGLYLVSVLERENVDLTEFDMLALEAFKPNRSQLGGK